MMMALLSSQEINQKRELAKKLQKRMNAHFVEHAAYDINDALTSILALCDMEQVRSVPKIKEYIRHINKLLSDVRIYQDSSVFNARHVLKNVINILKDNFKGAVMLMDSFSDLEVFVEGDQEDLEYFLLLSFLLLSEKSKEEESVSPEIKINLLRKEKTALITLVRENHFFSETVLSEFQQQIKNFSGKIDLVQKESSLRIEIHLPLSLKKLFFDQSFDSQINLKNPTFKAAGSTVVKSFAKS